MIGYNETMNIVAKRLDGFISGSYGMIVNSKNSLIFYFRLDIFPLLYYYIHHK